MTFERRVDGQLVMFESPGSVCVEVLHAGNNDLPLEDCMRRLAVMCRSGTTLMGRTNE